MRTTLIGFGVMLALTLSASTASAQYYPPQNYPPYYNSSCCVPYIPKAPDACGPGWYGVNNFGQVVGPNYNVYPCFGPWNGAIFPPAQASGQNGQQGGPMAFPNHPFARSPRDFFMYYEREQDWSPYNRGAR